MRIELVQLPRLSDTTVSYEHRLAPWLSHSVFAWLGFRPVLAQHTRAEHLAIKRWAANRRSLAEIGVAEGVSALGIRESMADNATLYLVDPFHLSRVPALKPSNGDTRPTDYSASLIFAAVSLANPFDAIFTTIDFPAVDRLNQCGIKLGR